jgi:hypothetical protein
MRIFRDHAAHYLFRSLSAEEKERVLDAGIKLDGILSETKALHVASR